MVDSQTFVGGFIMSQVDPNFQGGSTRTMVFDPLGIIGNEAVISG